MNLLLIGNHTCGNRGDGAILRGLIHALETQYPGVQLTVTSRYPISSSYLLGREVVSDPFEKWHRRRTPGLLGKVKAKIAQKAIPTIMLMRLRTGWGWLESLLPAQMQSEIKKLQKYDAVIQVGGSFFVDLYGPGQFEYPFAALLANRPLHLIGHSLGPFEGRLPQELARMLLERSKVVVLREPVSRELMIKYGMPMANVTEGVDCAWAVPPSRNTRPPLRWIEARVEKRPLIAITMRELAPFDKRLNTTQEAYEQAFASLVTRMIAQGYDVIAASTCTGIDSYHRDDRMNALRVAEKVAQPTHFHVAMDEFDDVGLGEMFASCDLLIGTRLHSTIIAMNFGTPAVAINYEHKSEGVMRQLGLPALSQPVQALLDGSLTSHVLTLLESLPQLRSQVAGAVAIERARALKMVDGGF